MNYDIVIATRNRPDALALSLPLLLAQTRLPRSVVIVDSSDDHGEVERAVKTAERNSEIPVDLVRSEPGTSFQRNFGLERAEAEVVFFPDDDSLCGPEVAERIMRIYECDPDVAAVCAAESPTPPEGVLDHSPGAYRMTPADRFKQRIAHTRAKVERRLAPDPFITLGAELISGRSRPSWLESENAVLVPWMTGFRMSFRREVIERVRFCEGLGRYSLFEDVDASYAAWRNGLVVGARSARIYHHKAPGSRAEPRRLGASQLLNRAYIVARHAEDPGRWIGRVSRYARYKALQYAAGGGGERLLGARRAIRRIPDIMRAAPAERDDVYRRAIEECLA